MTMPIVRPLAAVTLSMVLALFAMAGCDQLNKPIGHPSGSSGTTNGGGAAKTDGGADPEGGSTEGPILPGITAQPGDIQI